MTGDTREFPVRRNGLEAAGNKRGGRVRIRYNRVPHLPAITAGGHAGEVTATGAGMRPLVAAVPGIGLGAIAGEPGGAVPVRYNEVADWPAATAAGHWGKVVTVGAGMLP